MEMRRPLSTYHRDKKELEEEEVVVRSQFEINHIRGQDRIGRRNMVILVY